jgi:hypothetical protein
VVQRTATIGSRGAANDDRHVDLARRSVVIGRHHVDDLVEATRDEIDELHLGHHGLSV